MAKHRSQLSKNCETAIKQRWQNVFCNVSELSDGGNQEKWKNRTMEARKPAAGTARI